MTTACPIAAPPCNAPAPGVCPASLVPDVDRDAVALEMIEWRPHYVLVTPEHRAAFERLVTFTIRLKRCRAQESALLHCERTRAALRWDQERRAQAEALGKGLARRPAFVASQLRQTKQGVEWMLERWRRLGALLEEQKGAWDRAQKALALDLIGMPKELRGKSPRVPDPAAMVIEEIARLETLRADSLDAMDELERNMAMAGTSPEPSAAMLRLQRDEAACRRDYDRAAEKLRAQHVAPAPPAPALAPGPAKSPEPAPAPAPERADCGPGPAGAGQAVPPRRAPQVVPAMRREFPAPPRKSVYVPITVGVSQLERSRPR